MSEVTLRPITPGDLPFLSRVYSSTRRNEMAQTGWNPKQIDAFLEMQFQAQHKYYMEHYAKARFDIVVVAGKAAGRLYVDRREDEIRIVDIALLDQYRGKGIGGRLLKEILDEAEQGGRAVRIHVEKNNPAMTLYKRLGFKQVDETGVYDLMERPCPQTA